MNVRIEVLVIFCCLSLCCRCVETFEKDLFFGENALFNISTSYLGPEQRIRQKGYPSEKHMIVTEDGYILGLHRISHGVRSDPSKRKGPVLLQHGLLGQSMDFLLLKSEKNLAFMLADDGYDVWLGNFRGNTHSKGHIALTPSDRAFWNYTWHESGIYDLPAMIDFILKTTNAEKLEYIAHSMGTTAFFVMLSEKPEYNEKISKGHLLAPVAFLKHVNDSVITAAASISNLIGRALENFSLEAFLFDGKLLYLIKDFGCNLLNWDKKFCINFLFLLGGANYEQYDKDLVGAALYHYPSSYSAKGINHYAQLLLSGEFRQYDYGHVKNIEHYGISTPPSYNLRNVATPIILYVGPNDYLGHLEDAKKLSLNLCSLEEFYIIKDPKFNHYDFVHSPHAKTLLYDEIMKRLTNA